MMTRTWIIAIVFTVSLYPPAWGQEPPGIRPLRHATSWVGNSFGGDGGGNGSGFWVQNGTDEIEVTPDGTVFVGISWDEAGRCAGLYKDGRINRVLLKEHDGKGKESAWGWGTANSAVAASGEHLYIANAGKKLLRFRWTPGELDSARFVDEVNIGSEAVGLNARDDRIVVVYPDAIETRRRGRSVPDRSIPGQGGSRRRDRRRREPLGARGKLGPAPYGGREGPGRHGPGPRDTDGDLPRLPGAAPGLRRRPPPASADLRRDRGRTSRTDGRLR